jgi:hypothetical protein
LQNFGVSGQREKPSMSPAELDAALGRPPSDTTKVSGGAIENFREGWAVHALGASATAHYFLRDGFDKAVALCRFSVPVRWLFGEGNFNRCHHCRRLAHKKSRISR